MTRARFTRRFAFLSGLLLAVLISTAGAVASAQESVPESPPEIDEVIIQPQGYEFLIQVDAVDVLVRGSAPAQVAVNVEGTIGDGCTRLERIEQSREGNTISVRIIGYHTGDPVCTMLAQLYRDNIGIQGLFEPGEYVIDVNGVVRQFRVN